MHTNTTLLLSHQSAKPILTILDMYGAVRARRHIGNGVAGHYRSICQLHVLLPVGWCPCDAILRLLLFVNVMIQIIILVSVHYLCLALGWRIYTNAYSRNNASNDIPFILYTYSVGCLSWRWYALLVSRSHLKLSQIFPTWCSWWSASFSDAVSVVMPKKSIGR